MSNLLFITIDDLMSLSAWPLYQDVAITPNLDAFFAENTHFDSAFSDVALCNPSRASILTGQRPWDTGIINNSQTLSHHVDLATETLPGILKGAGFHTAIGGKVYHTLHPEQQPEVASEMLGSSGLRNAGAPDFVEIRGVAYGTTTRQLSDDTLTHNVEDFLETYDGDAPFAVFAGLYRPHVDWIIPQEYLDLYADVDIPLPDFVDDTDRAEFMSAVTSGFHSDVVEGGLWEDMVRHYLASISYADTKLGEMLSALQASGHADDTVTVVMSDHGYHLGDAQHWHKFTTYEQAARAPLAISAPGTAAQVVDAPVNLSSVTATVLDLLDVPTTDAMQPSLVDYVNGTASAGQSYAVTWMHASLSVRSDTYRYTLYENGEEELFDITSDIMNEDNLATDLPEIVAQLRAVAEDEIGADLMILPEEGAEGSAGDTSYYFNTTPVDVTDAGGIDTVYIGTHYTLPDDLENLHAIDGNGDVSLTGNAGDNRISGGLGKDHLFGQAGNDLLFGGGNDDRIFGGYGDDTLTGGAGIDELFGGDHDDVLYGQFGDDQIFGNWGNDRLYGGQGSDYMHGGLGDDELYGSFGNDVLEGFEDDDLLDGGDGYDIVDGGLGTDTAFVDGLSRDYFVTSGSVDDFILGGDNQQDTMISIERLRFTDVEMSVGEFFDFAQGATLSGNSQTNFLIGAGGSDTLSGGDGNDTLRAHAGIDVVFAGNGDDLLEGGAGRDYLNGGTGKDTATYANASASVEVYLNLGMAYSAEGDDNLMLIEDVIGSAFSDRLSGNNQANRLKGGDGDDILRGRSKNDMLAGEAGSDRVYGDDGNDTLFGGTGRDYLLGGTGKDHLHGGQGNDVLTGGNGEGVFDGHEDVFVFGLSSDGYGGFDRIKDFENGIDRLDLSLFGFTDFDTQVAPLAVSRGDGADTRIKFAQGDVLYIDNFNIADFDASDVIL